MAPLLKRKIDMVDSMVNRTSTNGSSIWDTFTGAAGDLFDTGKDIINDVARNTVMDVAGAAKTQLPNWINSHLGLQTKDQLERETFIPGNSDRYNSQYYSLDDLTTGQSPITNVDRIPEVQKSAFISAVDLSGSGNAAIYIVVAGVVGYFVIKSFLR